MNEIKICTAVFDSEDATCSLLAGHDSDHAAAMFDGEWIWWSEETGEETTRMHASPMWAESDADGLVVTPMMRVIHSQGQMIETLTSVLFSGVPIPPNEGDDE